MQMRTLDDVKGYYNLAAPIWTAFCEQIGNPGQDMKLLGALPAQVIGAALEQALLPDGTSLTAVQAAHVGLVYQLTKRILHTRSGGNWDQWEADNVFGEPRVPSTTTSASSSTVTAERKLKMTHILDQADDGDFTVMPEDTKVKWAQKFIEITGGWPHEEEEATLEQMSALHRRIYVQQIAPFTDFSVWLPYGQRALRASKFRSYVLTDKGYVTKDLPGPSNFVQWRACFRVLRTALISLQACKIATLHSYELAIERLARLYPTAWHLVYSGDELARSSHSNRLKLKLDMDERSGSQMPSGWDPNMPWDFVFQQIVGDDSFWQQQVHGPALVWLASGGRGTPKTPAEQVAMDYMRGGISAITPGIDGLHQEGAAGKGSQNEPRKSANRSRREAQKRKHAAEKEELQKYREKGNGTKGQGKNPAKQKCYGWNNGNGPCGELPPGQACASKVSREHRCTICDSPGHPSRSCPQKKK